MNRFVGTLSAAVRQTGREMRNSGPAILALCSELVPCGEGARGRQGEPGRCSAPTARQKNNPQGFLKHCPRPNPESTLGAGAYRLGQAGAGPSPARQEGLPKHRPGRILGTPGTSESFRPEAGVSERPAMHSSHAHAPPSGAARLGVLTPTAAPLQHSPGACLHT